MKTKMCVKVAGFCTCSLYVELVICWQGAKVFCY